MEDIKKAIEELKVIAANCLRIYDRGYIDGANAFFEAAKEMLGEAVSNAAKNALSGKLDKQSPDGYDRVYSVSWSGKHGTLNVYPTILKNSVDYERLKSSLVLRDSKKGYAYSITPDDDDDDSEAKKLMRVANVEYVRKHIPLVPNRPIYIPKDYTTILDNIKNYTDKDYISNDHAYAFWSDSSFNRKANVGDLFSCTCSSNDGYVFCIRARVVQATGNWVYFAIDDVNKDQQEDFILYHTPKEIPLVPNRPIYVKRKFAEILEDVKNGAGNDDYWIKFNDTYYAFLPTDFNRKAVVGDKFGCTCSSSDKYVFEISAQVIKVEENRVWFKILDKNLDTSDDFVLLHDGSIDDAVEALKNEPDISQANAVGTPEVTIDKENKRLVFKNLKGNPGGAEYFSQLKSEVVDLFSLMTQESSHPFATVNAKEEVSKSYTSTQMKNFRNKLYSGTYLALLSLGDATFSGWLTIKKAGKQGDVYHSVVSFADRGILSILWYWHEDEISDGIQITYKNLLNGNVGMSGLKLILITQNGIELSE